MSVVSLCVVRCGFPLLSPKQRVPPRPPETGFPDTQRPDILCVRNNEGRLGGLSRTTGGLSFLGLIKKEKDDVRLHPNYKKGSDTQDCKGEPDQSPPGYGILEVSLVQGVCQKNGSICFLCGGNSGGIGYDSG